MQGEEVKVQGEKVEFLEFRAPVLKGSADDRSPPKLVKIALRGGRPCPDGRRIPRLIAIDPEPVQEGDGWAIDEAGTAQWSVTHAHGTSVHL